MTDRASVSPHADVLLLNSGDIKLDDDMHHQTINEDPINIALLQRTCGEEVAREILEVFVSAATA